MFRDKRISKRKLTEIDRVTRRDQYLRERTIPDEVHEGWVLVKNTNTDEPTGYDRYTVGRLGPLLWDLDQVGSDPICEFRVFKGASSGVGGDNWPVAVLQQPLAQNEVGWAAIRGITPVKIQPDPTNAPQILHQQFYGYPTITGELALSNSGGKMRVLTPVTTGPSNTIPGQIVLAEFCEYTVTQIPFTSLFDPGSRTTDVQFISVGVGDDPASDSRRGAASPITAGGNLMTFQRAGVYRVTTSLNMGGGTVGAWATSCETQWVNTANTVRSPLRRFERHNFLNFNPGFTEVGEYVDWITVARGEQLRLVLTNGQINRITNFGVSNLLPATAGNMPAPTGRVAIELVVPIWDATDRAAKTTTVAVAPIGFATADDPDAGGTTTANHDDGSGAIVSFDPAIDPIP